MSPPSTTVIRGAARTARNHTRVNLHDDAAARRQGLRGGVVGAPYNLYLVHALLYEQLGERWLEHGRLAARFIEPVYDGDELRARAELATADDDLVSTWTIDNQSGATIARGVAAWSSTHDEPSSEAGAPPDATGDTTGDTTGEAPSGPLAAGEDVPAQSVSFDPDDLGSYLSQNGLLEHGAGGPDAPVPHSYLVRWMFMPARRYLDERGIRGGLYGEVDVCLFRRMRSEIEYRYGATITDVRWKAPLQFIELEMVAREPGGALACVMRQMHIIPHRDSERGDAHDAAP